MEDLVGFLGGMSALLATLTFMSCRSCVGLLRSIRIDTNEIPGYGTFYKLHSSLWIAFGIALATHLTIASSLAISGTSFEGNPSQRYIVLWLGIAIFVTALSLFLSCRLYPKIAKALTGKSPMSSKWFGAYFKTHTYQWVILISLILLHLSLGEGLN